MSQSLSSILVHIVTSTKDRYPFIKPEIRPELHAYAKEVLRACDSPALAMNAMPDHIHILCVLSKKWAVCDLIEEVKKSTSKWIKSRGGILSKFSWQGGYGAFSVSASRAESVEAYIANQEAHHQRVTFEDELRALLRKHGIAFDERYLWD